MRQKSSLIMLGFIKVRLIMDVLKPEIVQPAPWDMQFAEDIVLIDTTREGAEQKLKNGEERWRVNGL